MNITLRPVLAGRGI